MPTASTAGPVEERRLATVLFGDLVGFTSLAERLDPEEVREIQGVYFERMSAEVARFGGKIDKYAGDAVLALFGVPIAHEDDPERAVRCGLAMQQALKELGPQIRARWGTELALRVGVETGEVVAGEWRIEGRRDYAVTGDVVNTAARLQTAAQPGEVLVGAMTKRLAEQGILFSEPRDLTVKGKVNRVVAHVAQEPRARVAERWEARTYHTPLVGREMEMTRLFDAWTRAEGGQGQLVTLVGDAGVGKSRLLAEALIRMSDAGAVRQVRGRSLSYGQGISLWLIADLLRSIFNIADGSGSDNVAVQVRKACEALLGEQDEETRAAAVDVFGEVLGLPIGTSPIANVGAQVRRQILVRSLRSLLTMLSWGDPTVLVLEDLHWIDQASSAVLHGVLDQVPTLKLLVLTSQRPGWNPPWSEWGWPERITIFPLDGSSATAMAGAVLDGVLLSPELEQYVTERAGGNPFFVEELLHMLDETGGLTRTNGRAQLAAEATEHLPATLTEVLLARLDRLDRQVLDVAQVASVIGRSFAVRLLAQVSRRDVGALEVPLNALEQAEIVFSRPSSEPEYIFKHALVRDVAYQTLLQRRRAELHGDVARAIARLYPADEYVEMIAFHYGRTSQSAEAAAWLERAGDRARDVYSNDVAIAHYEEARRRLQMSGANELALNRVAEKLGQVLKIVARNDDALVVLEEAARGYARSGDVAGQLRTVAQIGRAHADRATPEEGIARIQTVLDRLDLGEPSTGLAEARAALSHLLYRAAKYSESLVAAESAVQLARALGDMRIQAEAGFRRGWLLSVLGREVEGREVLEETVPLAEAAADLGNLESSLNALGVSYWKGGDFDAASTYFGQAAEVAERMGNPARYAWELAWLGYSLFHRGDCKSARVQLEQSQRVPGASGGAWLAAFPSLFVGHLSLIEGNWEEASRSLEDARATAERGQNFDVLPLAEGLLAELSLLRGDGQDVTDRLERYLGVKSLAVALMLPILASAHLAFGREERAQALIEQGILAARRISRLALVDALRVQATVSMRQTRWEDAERALEEALELADTMPYPLGAARARHELGILNIQRGEPGRGRERLNEALGIFQQLGAEPYLERTNQALAEQTRPGSPRRRSGRHKSVG